MKLKRKRQAGEANKKAEEEQRKKAIEQKTLVTRRKAKTGETPLVKPELKKGSLLRKKLLSQSEKNFLRKSKESLRERVFYPMLKSKNLYDLLNLLQKQSKYQIQLQ